MIYYLIISLILNFFLLFLWINANRGWNRALKGWKYAVEQWRDTINQWNDTLDHKENLIELIQLLTQNAEKNSD